MTYTAAYLAVLFPRLAKLYEQISGKNIPYRNNALVLAKFPERNERKTPIALARFNPNILEKLPE